MRDYEAYRALVQKGLEDVWSQLSNAPVLLREAMEYSLSAGGKRLRPVMLLAACEAAGGNMEAAMPFACALEMIHTYSLIHDDLPAMDNDDYRRGRLTNHKVYGDAVAILAGDGLLSAAMELMSKSAMSFDDFRGLKAMERITTRAGIGGMVGGQTMDVISEGKAPSMETVSYIHAHKTADLLTAPMEAGLLLAGADAGMVEAGREYGSHFGIAFQMVDDLLDVNGDPDVMGKAAGSDEKAGKMTWVACKGIRETEKEAAEHLRLAVIAAEKLGIPGEFFRTLAETSLHRVK